MNVRGVILDLGHTLMHLDGAWAEVFEWGVASLAAYVAGQGWGLDGEALGRALLARRQAGFEAAQATQREVTADQTMRETLIEFGLPEPSLGQVRGALDAFFAPEAERWRADPDALPVLRKLVGRGLRLGMFSNATHDPFIQALVDRLGYRFWLRPALSSAATLVRKPDPAALRPFLDAWRLPPEAVVMVGDRLEADILGAQRAGMRSVWYHSRPDARQEGESDAAAPLPAPVVPDATIERLAELPAVLGRWGM